MWGPPGWKFLHTVTFNYPLSIDLSNSDHRKLVKHIKELFENGTNNTTRLQPHGQGQLDHDYNDTDLRPLQGEWIARLP